MNTSATGSRARIDALCSCVYQQPDWAIMAFTPMTTVTVEQIDQMRGAPVESHHLEFKAAQMTYAKDQLAEYCCALANEGGGFFILGIADRPDPTTNLRKVVGTRVFSPATEVELYLLTRVGLRVEAYEVAHPDGRVVAFSIPGRPQGVPLHIGGTYFMRSGQSLVGMSADRLRAIFAEGAPPWSSLPIATGLSGSDVIDRLDAQTFFELLERAYPQTQTGVLEALAQRGAVKLEADGYSISNLGALLLAKDLKKNFPELARRAPRVVVYSGIDKLATKIDQTGVRGYAVGFKSLIGFVASQMPRREVVTEGGLRRDDLLVPEIVIRELAANALIHQDLTQTGMSPMIEIYSNRIEITNPGVPLLPTNRFIDSWGSRNEDLALMMRAFGICEEKGSGIDRVIDATETARLTAPDILTSEGRTHVVVFGPQAFADMTVDERIRACFQHCALRYVKRSPMTNQSLRQRFQLEDDKISNVSQVISATANIGLIKADETAGGSRRYSRYVPFWA